MNAWIRKAFACVQHNQRTRQTWKPSMKILIADKFSEAISTGLINSVAKSLTTPPSKPTNCPSLSPRTTSWSCAANRSPPRRSGLRTACPVLRAGAGVNTIDVKAASARGIYVTNCPGKNSIAVAELVFALLLAIDRRIADNVAALRAHQWNKKEFSKADGIYGKTLGVIGVGRIGREVITRARAFGLRSSPGRVRYTRGRRRNWASNVATTWTTFSAAPTS